MRVWNGKTMNECHNANPKYNRTIVPIPSININNIVEILGGLPKNKQKDVFPSNHKYIGFIMFFIPLISSINCVEEINFHFHLCVGKWIFGTKM